jgi:hypothetical protein
MMNATKKRTTKPMPVAAPNRSQFIPYASIADSVLCVGVGQGSPTEEGSRTRVRIAPINKYRARTPISFTRTRSARKRA